LVNAANGTVLSTQEIIRIINAAEGNPKNEVFGIWNVEKSEGETKSLVSSF
jgi:hypothetical protein